MSNDTGVTQVVDRRESVQKDRIARLERMHEIRRLEDTVQQLFSEGLLHGTTHTAQGQEAVAVGLAAALRQTDIVTCTYRGHGMALALGMEPQPVLGEIMGRVVGCIGGVGGSMHLCDMRVGLLPTFAIVGAGLPVAAGAALTAQVLDQDNIGVAVFGDGATNIGAFHETLNLASIWRLPALFVIENNVYGEYSRIDLTTPIQDLALRGDAYAMPWEIVDGQDVDEVARAVSQAAQAIRNERRPMLLELKTYRYAGHSRSDKATYRPSGEFDAWYERDPINSYELRLIEEQLLTYEDAKELIARVDARLADAVETVKASPEPDIGAMFDHVWAT